MPRWENRPVEIANLLNPAFCAVLLQDTLKAYVEINNFGMSYPLMFVVLPVVLHKATRNKFPKTTQTTLSEWLQSHSDIRLAFVERTRQLVPYTKEALIFGFQQGIFLLDENNENGYILPTKKDLASLPSWSKNSEPFDCREKAKFTGRWFAQTGDASTIYKTFGIRP